MLRGSEEEIEAPGPYQVPWQVSWPEARSAKKIRRPNRARQVCKDSPLEEGVSCELVSENAKIPC